MANGFDTRFVRGTEGDSRKSAGKAFHEALPSSASIFRDLTGLTVDVPSSTAMQADITGPKSINSLPDTNVGFQLLKRSGWKEGSGLGVFEQGRLDPLEVQFKSDRRGIGAEDKRKQKINEQLREESSAEDGLKATKKEKKLSKKARKMKAAEEQMQEQAFQQEFYRAFWPENV